MFNRYNMQMQCIVALSWSVEVLQPLLTVSWKLVFHGAAASQCSYVITVSLWQF